MGSGREGGSPSTVGGGGGKTGGAPMSPSLYHRLQREELLEGGSNAMALDLSNALHGATLRISSTNVLLSPRRLDGSAAPLPDPSKLRSPRGGTPLHSPRSLSPLPSPKAVMNPIDATVDFQDAILRSGGQLRKSPTMPRAENPPPSEDGPAIARRTRSDISEGRHKSPFSNSRRFKAEAAAVALLEEEVPRNRKPDLSLATTTQAATEWVVSEKGKSPRRGPVKAVEMQQEGGVPNERPSSKTSSKSSTRRTKAEVQEVQEGDLGMGDANRASRRSHSRTHTRQYKRKASDPVPALPLALPEEEPYPQPSERPPLQPPESSYPPPPPQRTARCSSSTAAPRRVSREARTSESSDWLQLSVDIFMWRHIPRSALLFGVGCFCVLSTSVIQDMQYSVISVLAYLALFFLAVTFFKHTFLRGATPDSFSSSYTMTESDALKLIRVLLPAINSMLNKFSELFSGEPVMTLKVAAALWLLAQAGYIMNLWTLARFAYFALFIIPKCYSCYYAQIFGYARNFWHWGWATWNACAHKRAVAFAAFALAWNFSSTSTRICGAFISVVALRAYQHLLRVELENGNMMMFEDDKSLGMNSAPSHGLELMRLPQPGFEHNL